MARLSTLSQESGQPSTSPLVFTGLHVKDEGVGYVSDGTSDGSSLYVLDAASGERTRLTSGPFNDQDPCWSPDGKWIAFSSNRPTEPKKDWGRSLFRVAARADTVPELLAAVEGPPSHLDVSSDGRHIAIGFNSPARFGPARLALLELESHTLRPVGDDLDRDLGWPTFSSDGSWLYFLMADAGNQHVARVPVLGGTVERIVSGDRYVSAYALGPAGDLVIIASDPMRPTEIFAVSGNELRAITRVNAAALEGVQLAGVERFKARSRDGTVVEAFLVRPPGTDVRAPFPTLLRIHGGPDVQDTTEFNVEWQLFAAQGYAVVAGNPRGVVPRVRDLLCGCD